MRYKRVVLVTLVAAVITAWLVFVVDGMARACPSCATTTTGGVTTTEITTTLPTTTEQTTTTAPEVTTTLEVTTTEVTTTTLPEVTTTGVEVSTTAPVEHTLPEVLPETGPAEDLMMIGRTGVWIVAGGIALLGLAALVGRWLARCDRKGHLWVAWAEGSSGRIGEGRAYSCSRCGVVGTD